MYALKFFKTTAVIVILLTFVFQIAFGNDIEKKLEQDAKLANEAFNRCRNYLDAWKNYIDDESGLLRENLAKGKNVWTPENSAADNFPFMIITSTFTKPEIAGPLLWKSLVGEKTLTLSQFGLPDAYDIDKKMKLGYNLDRLIFGASEYAKDGLVPMVEILGKGVWSERMEELINGIIDASPEKTKYGNLPSTDSEVNGEMLQILCRLYWMTGKEKYLEYAERIGDAYCYEIIPSNNWLPAHHWNFDTKKGDGKFKSRDHGCEIVSGLALLYAIESEKNSSRVNSYYLAVKKMLERIQEIAADNSGQLYNEVDVRNGKITNESLSDCWGYIYYGYYTFYMATGEKKYKNYVEHVLKNIHKYRNYKWEPRSGGKQSHDGYADSIEGALGLLCLLPVKTAFDWVETEIQRLFAFQKENGIIEGWYGDGNFARTVLMYAFYKTQGLYCKPWRDDLLLSAERTERGLEVYIQSDKPWTGKICFDPPRHHRYLGMPENYPRINAFPEWYVVEPLSVYIISKNGGEQEKVIGENLITGYDIKLNGNDVMRFNVSGY